MLQEVVNHKVYVFCNWLYKSHGKLSIFFIFFSVYRDIASYVDRHITFLFQHLFGDVKLFCLHITWRGDKMYLSTQGYDETPHIHLVQAQTKLIKVSQCCVWILMVQLVNNSPKNVILHVCYIWWQELKSHLIDCRSHSEIDIQEDTWEHLVAV